MASLNSNLLLSSLRSAGCIRIAVTDPKRLSELRNRVAIEAARLGRAVNCSYRHPWLYVTLGEKPTNSGHFEQLRVRTLEAA
jgi:hypothetical protein